MEKLQEYEGTYYRKLAPGEVLREGDTCWSPEGCLTSFAGLPVGKERFDCGYFRKATIEGTRRKLDKGEKILSTDTARFGSTFAYGTVVTSDLYRQVELPKCKLVEDYNSRLAAGKVIRDREPDIIKAPKPTLEQALDTLQTALAAQKRVGADAKEKADTLVKAHREDAVANAALKASGDKIHKALAALCELAAT